MSAATPLRIGQTNGAGATDALFLKVYGGEVLTAFDEVNVMERLQMIRNIQSGKSAQFPATWKVDASYHTPGAEIVGQTSNVAERVITIDDLLISDVFIPLIDEAKNHYEYRAEYSKQSGRALAYLRPEQPAGCLPGSSCVCYRHRCKRRSPADQRWLRDDWFNHRFWHLRRG